MPQSIRSILHSLTNQQAKLSTMRITADADTKRLIDAQLDDLQAQIDSLVEDHS